VTVGLSNYSRTRSRIGLWLSISTEIDDLERPLGYIALFHKIRQVWDQSRRFTTINTNNVGMGAAPPGMGKNVEEQLPPPSLGNALAVTAQFS